MIIIRHSFKFLRPVVISEQVLFREKSTILSKIRKPNIQSYSGLDRNMDNKQDAGDVVVEQQNLVKELDPLPDFIGKRQKLWDKFKKRYGQELKAKEPKSIKIDTFDKSGSPKSVDGESWRTTPYQIACKVVSKGWADNLVISKVNGVLWDLDRVLEEDSKIEFLKFDNEEAQQVFWHSTAHILGEAVERIYGGHLCYGPPIKDGFYYDIYMCNECHPEVDKENTDQKQSNGVYVPPSTVSKFHYDTIESVMKRVCNERQPFERLLLSKQELLDLLSYNKFKVRIINERIKEDFTTAYRCGTLIDLCRGPHVRNTGYIKSFQITKSSSSYWEGKADAEVLQRVYGISFPEPKQLKEWQRIQEEAAKRDHRKIGVEHGLFFFHELSPGSCFFTPKGAIVYNALIDFIKSEYRKRGFNEVISPNIYNVELWKKSGHWEHYAENMFSFEIEKETFALKPMNCPGHCLLFDSTTRSWRDLPLRFADFGVLHRNELSGALSGLTRVRRFVQDDAHIFCTHSQIGSEIDGALDFLRNVYSLLGFTYELRLSTRPEKYLGELEVWNQAEAALKDALDRHGLVWEINEGDGAFYGPKIDITIKDALKRDFQCATIQLDFQLPSRFKLHFINEESAKVQPVIIHRAVLGSLERFIAILTENFAGKWPFWLSPRQAIVLPIRDAIDPYAIELKDIIHKAGFHVDVELDASLTINKKVRNAQLAQYNFILVVGDKEKENRTVNVRTRDNKVHGEISIEGLIEKFNTFKESRGLKVEEHF